MLEDMKYFANGLLFLESTKSADAGKTVKITGTTGATVSVTLDSSLRAKAYIPNRDRYIVQLMNGAAVEASAQVIYGFGECKKLSINS